MWLSTLLERYHSAREALYRAHTPEFVTTADEAPIPGHSARWSSSDAVDGTARPRLISSMPSHHDDEPWLVIPAHRQIFANWHLHLDQIEAYFFDFDYTLAEYEGVKALLYHQMLRFLVEQKGYPDELLALQFDPVFAQRGAYLHPEQGVSVKFDKNKVPTRGFRGRTPLRPDELERLRADKYAGALRIEFHSKQFIDSHFQFVDLCLASDLW